MSLSRVLSSRQLKKKKIKFPSYNSALSLKNASNELSYLFHAFNQSIQLTNSLIFLLYTCLCNLHLFICLFDSFQKPICFLL